MTPRERTTGISWTEHTWNPFAGCTIHSAGCTNCYAMAAAARLESFGQPTYKGTTRLANGKPIWTGKINRATPATWRKPFTIREPSIIFVNSMSDFFHEGAPDSWRVEALGVMAATPHQYQVLTKRPERVAPFFERHEIACPDNVWLGATVERGDFATRIDTVRAYPARIRFLSIEPLIGAMGEVNLNGISWVIVGGESGPGARPMQPEWVREIRDQCIGAGVPLWFKQWGLARNNPLFAQGGARAVSQLDPQEKGGNTLDGRQWHEYPPFELQAALF